jgi:hypothetical protein
VRKGNPIGSGLGDAWRDSVLDRLPEGASPLEKAKAFADAICADFDGNGQKPLGEKALQNRLAKHTTLIEQFETRFPDLHAKVIDAYERAMIKATGGDDAKWSAQ